MISTTERIAHLAEGRILGVSAFLTLPLAILAPKGVALLFGLTAVSSFIVGLAHRQKNRGPVGPSLALAAAFILLSLSSAMWSMTPESSFKKALVLGLVLFGGLVLTFSARRLKGEARRVFEIGLIAGGVLGFGVIAIEVAFSSPILALPGTIMGRPTEQNIVLLRGINQGAAVASVFILPWTIALWRHKGVLWASAGFTVCVTVLAFCQADSHKAALVIGMAAALIAFVGGRPVLRGFSLLCVLGVLSSPWLVSALPDPLQPDNNAAVLPNSSQHRLVIWQTTAGHIFERPFFGSGFDTARAFYGPDQKVAYFFGGKEADTKWSNLFEPIPLHPHNGTLQVWLELGAAGAALLAAGLFLIVRRLAAVSNNFERSILFGTFVTGLVIFSISYGAWQGWWMGAIWLMMAFAAAFFTVNAE